MFSWREESTHRSIWDRSSFDVGRVFRLQRDTRHEIFCLLKENEKRSLENCVGGRSTNSVSWDWSVHLWFDKLTMNRWTCRGRIPPGHWVKQGETGRLATEVEREETGGHPTRTGLILRPFDKLMVLSEVEAQTQDGEQSRTINQAPTKTFPKFNFFRALF